MAQAWPYFGPTQVLPFMVQQNVRRASPPKDFKDFPGKTCGFFFQEGWEAGQLDSGWRWSWGVLVTYPRFIAIWCNFDGKNRWESIGIRNALSSNKPKSFWTQMGLPRHGILTPSELNFDMETDDKPLDFRVRSIGRYLHTTKMVQENVCDKGG